MKSNISRRNFLKTSVAAGTSMALSAASYGRVVGANDRISVGIIGCGGRGVYAHMKNVSPYYKSENFQVSVVCDTWRQRQERAAKQAVEYFGAEPKQCFSYKEVLADKNIDAVMIASCDHQHTTHLKAAAEAKKDAYCEKPLAMDLGRLIEACDAVKKAGIVVQIGTQLRSLPTMAGCRELYKTGILGKVTRIEQVRNGSKPYWYPRLAEVNEKDVDWKEFLMHLPYRPFDQSRYSGWYGYRDFSDGPVPGLASHFIDLIHYITGAKFPKSCICMGGTYEWKDKYNFTCPDQVQAMWEYPEDFLVSYSTNFGNGGNNFCKFFGDQGTLDIPNWNTPALSAEGGFKNKGVIRGKTDVEPVDQPDHYLNWLQCLRNRKTPNASIDAGYQHAVAVIMAMKAFDTGKRMIYDSDKREIMEG